MSTSCGISTTNFSACVSLSLHHTSTFVSPFHTTSQLLQTLILTGREGIIEAVTTLCPLQPQPDPLSPPGCKASPGAGGVHAASLDSSLREGGNGGGSAMLHFDSAQGQDPHDRSIFGFTTMLVKQPIFHER